MKHNKYSIYYDHIQYQMIEWEVPEDIEVKPEWGLENYDLIRWGIEHGVFDLLPIYDYDEEGNALDEDGEPYGEDCLQASIWHDDYYDYVIPFYEFRIEEAGRSELVHKLEDLVHGKPAIRERVK